MNVNLWAAYAKGLEYVYWQWLNCLIVKLLLLSTKQCNKIFGNLHLIPYVLVCADNAYEYKRKARKNRKVICIHVKLMLIINAFVNIRNLYNFIIWGEKLTICVKYSKKLLIRNYRLLNSCSFKILLDWCILSHSLKYISILLNHIFFLYFDFFVRSSCLI